MITEDGDETIIAPVTVAATDYTGDYFGFVNRARARNYVEVAQIHRKDSPCLGLWTIRASPSKSSPNPRPSRSWALAGCSRSVADAVHKIF